MPSPTEITVSQLSRRIGLPDSPAIVDVRVDEDFAADPRLIPGSRRRHAQSVEDWAPAYAGRHVVVACQKGKKLSQGTAAWLRHLGHSAESLEGGNLAWAAAGPQHTRSRSSHWARRKPLVPAVRFQSRTYAAPRRRWDRAGRSAYGACMIRARRGS